MIHNDKNTSNYVVKCPRQHVPASLDAFNRLRAAKDARGQNIEVYKIHQPTPLFATEVVALMLSRRLSFDANRV
jgi:hypothetical protein